MDNDKNEQKDLNIEKLYKINNELNAKVSTMEKQLNDLTIFCKNSINITSSKTDNKEEEEKKHKLLEEKLRRNIYGK